MFSLTFCILVAVPLYVVSAAPKYVWPLGNTTVHKEVMCGRDAHLPAAHQCFVFSEGYPGLPYTALTLSGEDNSFVDFYLSGRHEFTDLALSLYVYPTGEPEGTILNYLCETGNVIKLSVLQGLLFVSFWDEYGVSVGATAVPELLVAEAWNHVVVSRDYSTGRIKVYHNGDLVDDIDDDFPNKIRLPVKGSIRLGSDQKAESEPKFKGRFSCVQLYMTLPSDLEVKDAQQFCQPDAWRIVPDITLSPRSQDGVIQQCVTDYVEPTEGADAEPKDCDVIDMGCLYSGVNWAWVLRKYSWSASERDSGHFRLVKTDRLPPDSDPGLLGGVIVVDGKLCPRLCLRVLGCHGYGVHTESADVTRCLLYQRVTDATELRPGSTYFSVL